MIRAIIEHPEICLIGAFTLIQISPIQINPWSKLLQMISEALVGDLKKEVSELKVEMKNEKVATTRWNILSFANSCRLGVQHDKEEWDHCLEELSWYESYCKENKIPNGKIEESSKYLRAIYQKILSNNSFL